MSYKVDFENLQQYNEYRKLAPLGPREWGRQGLYVLDSGF